MATKWNTQDFRIKINEISPSIEIIGEYKNMHTKIKCRCKIDGHIWDATPTHLLFDGRGCPKCNGGVSKTHDAFIEQVKSINPLIKVLGKYIRDNEKVEFQCLTDGCIWKTKPTHIMQGHGCPKCNESMGEKAIVSFLTKNNITYLREHRFRDCKDKHTLPFDFYLEALNTCIEYDGEQHFRPRDVWGGEEALKRQKQRDKIKSNYCEHNGINLIRVSYRIKNIEKYLSQKIIESKVEVIDRRQYGI